MTTSPECGCELIHNTHLDTGGVLLGALARQRRLDSVKLRLEPRGSGHQQGGRGAETRAGRDVGSHSDRLRRHTKLLTDRTKILEPAFYPARHRPFRSGMPGDDRMAVHSGGQYHASQIVHVLADE